MDWSRLFTHHGRVARKEFWLSYLGLSIAPYLPLTLSSWTPWLASGLTILGSLVSAVAMALLSIKRLHDTNRSGWWLAKPTLASVVLLLVACIGLATSFAALYPRHQPVAHAGAGFVFGGIALVLLGLLNLYVFYVLGLQEGDSGANRFGAPNNGSVLQGA